MPFANFQTFADCVRKMSGKKKDPKAWCAQVKKRTEGERTSRRKNK